MLNPEIKTKWLAALRSGAYKQGKFYLRDSEQQYCCLGVLCNIVDDKQWTECSEVKAYIYSDFEAAYYYMVPDDVAKSVGLTCSAQRNLSIMNDKGVPFEKIADYIEVNL